MLENAEHSAAAPFCSVTREFRYVTANHGPRKRMTKSNNSEDTAL